MVLKEGLERRRPSVHGCSVPVHTQSTPEIGVEWTPQENTGYHYIFFKMPNCYMAILKWEFGIGLRDKQMLNFDWETKGCMRAGGATYDRGLDKHQSWSWLGQGKEGKAATGGYSRAGVEDSHLNAACLSYWQEQWRMRWRCHANVRLEYILMGWMIEYAVLVNLVDVVVTIQWPSSSLGFSQV